MITDDLVTRLILPVRCPCCDLVCTDPVQREAADTIERLQSELADRDKTIEALLTNLNEAIEDIQDWGAYASQYFQDKHDLAGCVAAHRAAIDAAMGEK